MTRYTYATCLSFGADGEADYCELDATISYVVRQGRSGAVTAYGHVEASEEPEIEDIRVEKIDGHPVSTGDEPTVEAILSRFDTGDHDADLLAEAAKTDIYRREKRA